MVPKIEVSGLGKYTRNVGYKTGSITYEFETKTFNYDRGIRLLADVMDVEEAGVLDCFVEAGSELQRTQVAPEADAFTFAEIAGHEGVTTSEDDLSDADAADVLTELRAVTNLMDEAQVTAGSRYLFITPTLKGALDDFSLANPARSNRVLERFSRAVEVPQVRFYTAIDLLSGDEDQFGYACAAGNYQLTSDADVVMWQHLFGQVYERIGPASPNPTGVMQPSVGCGLQLSHRFTQPKSSVPSRPSEAKARPRTGSRSSTLLADSAAASSQGSPGRDADLSTPNAESSAPISPLQSSEPLPPRKTPMSAKGGAAFGKAALTRRAQRHGPPARTQAGPDATRARSGAAGAGRRHRRFRANIGAACFRTSTSVLSRALSRSNSMRRFRSGARLSAAAVEPHARTRRIRRSSAGLPGSCPHIASARGLLEPASATTRLLNSPVSCPGAPAPAWGLPSPKGPQTLIRPSR